MLKIGKRLVCAVMTVAVAVTAAFGGAVGVAADTIEDWAKPYSLGTKIEGNLTSYYYSANYNDNTYSFKLTTKTSVAAHIFSEAGTTDFRLLNSKGQELKPSKLNAVIGVAYDSQLRWNEAIGKAEATFQYTNLLPDTYYYALGKIPNYGGGQYFELTIAPEAPPVAPAFPAGATASDVTAAHNGSAVNVNWNAVTSARYAVYYIPRSNATGAFGTWNVASVDTPAFTIPAATGVTYYITILPYGDNPRVYGGFSAYTLVRT